jgi:hypothetical protein
VIWNSLKRFANVAAAALFERLSPIPARLPEKAGLPLRWAVLTISRGALPNRGERRGQPHGDKKGDQPLTCTVTVCARPDVAPLSSETSTSKLALLLPPPSWTKSTRPASISACVKFITEFPAAPASAM